MEGFTRSLPSSPLLHLRLAKRAGTVRLVLSARPPRLASPGLALSRLVLSCLVLSCLTGLSHGHDSLLEAKHRQTRFRTIPTQTQAAARHADGEPDGRLPPMGSVADESKTNKH